MLKDEGGQNWQRRDEEVQKWVEEYMLHWRVMVGPTANANTSLIFWRIIQVGSSSQNQLTFLQSISTVRSCSNWWTLWFRMWGGQYNIGYYWWCSTCLYWQLVTEASMSSFWIFAPCCINNTLRNIGGLFVSKQTIEKAKNFNICAIIVWVLKLTRSFTNKKLTRPINKRFATSYLTLRSIYDSKKKFNATLNPISRWSAL